MQWEELMQAPSGSTELDATTTWFCPLDNYALISAEGENTFTFLQGQCTCDINQLTRDAEGLGKSVMGAHCNHKGRMHSTFVGAKLSKKEALLRVHQSIGDHAQQNLQKYAMLSRVKVQVNADWSCFGIVGPQSASIISALATNTGAARAPAPGEYVLLNNDALVLCHTSNQFELWCRGAVDEKSFENILALPKQQNGNLFHMLSIQRGVAELEGPLIDTLIPQEINFQLTDGISFSKGCYTGQEIVARLHYKAQLKKHMYLGHVDLEETQTNAIQTGASLVQENGKSCGVVINAVPTLGSSQCLFLALCDDDALDDARLQIDENLCLKIQWGELPYAIS